MRSVSYFLDDHEENKICSVIFDLPDKNKVSFETAKGLLLFVHSHNNKTMCFCKIKKKYRVRSLPSQSLSPLFTDT